MFKPKAYIIFYTLPTNVQYPVIITYTRFFARFSTYHNLFYPCTEFSLEVYSGQQRFTDNDFMLYRSCFIKRKTVIHSVLIFHGATNGNIIIPVPPIRRQTLAEPVYAFSYKQEMKIVSFPHHFPCFYTPFIGFFYQKIGGKTSIDKIAGRDLVSLILFPSHGQIELSGFGYYGTVFPMFTISAIYITMPATCT